MKKNLLKVSGYVITALSVAVLAGWNFSNLYFDEVIPENMLVPAGKIMEADETEFTFAATGDTGSFNSSLERIIRKIRKRTDAKFILHLGDLVKYNNKAHFNWISHEIAAKLKGMPFYIISGNHEVSNGRKNIFMYRDTFGLPYYWFSYGNTMFIGLDTSLHILEDEQLEWLETILEKVRPQFKNCIIFTHIPPLNPRDEEDKELGEEVKDKLLAVLVKYEINLFITGHVHYFSESKLGNIPMITVPSSGQTSRAKNNAYGYVLVTMGQDGVREIKNNEMWMKPEAEILDVFVSSTLTKEETRNFALLGLLVGCLLLFLSKRRSVNK